MQTCYTATKLDYPGRPAVVESCAVEFHSERKSQNVTASDDQQCGSGTGLPCSMLYHIGVTGQAAVRHFANVRYVCVAGTDKRAWLIAEAIAARVGGGQVVEEIGRDRFVCLKVGSVICASHGMGAPSIAICLNELIHALQMSGNVLCPVFFRIGTTGGVGIKPGLVVTSTEALNEDLEPFYETHHVGKRHKYPTWMDQDIIRELMQEYPNQIVAGKTLTTLDFFENQGRVDGAFCSFQEADQQDFFARLIDRGVRNIEMEVVPFSAIVHRAGLRAVACCTVIVNRLEGEHISMAVQPNLAVAIVADFIANKLKALEMDLC